MHSPCLAKQRVVAHIALGSISAHNPVNAITLVQTHMHKRRKPLERDTEYRNSTKACQQRRGRARRGRQAIGRAWGVVERRGEGGAHPGSPVPPAQARPPMTR